MCGESFAQRLYYGFHKKEWVRQGKRSSWLLLNNFFFFFLKRILLFLNIYLFLFLAVLGLNCVWASSSCGDRGYSLLWCVGFS